MKSFLLLLLSAAPIAAQIPTQAPRETIPETISVTGTGHATLTPDRFSFTAGVQTTAPTVEEAVNQNNDKMSAVIAALKRAGASDQEVRTSNFSIFPQQVYEQGKPPRVTGYQANNSVTVTKSEVAAASKLLQVALSAGVNEMSALSFEVSDPSRGRDQGLRAAYEDARAKAALLAQAAGRTLNDHQRKDWRADAATAAANWRHGRKSRSGECCSCRERFARAVVHSLRRVRDALNR